RICHPLKQRKAFFLRMMQMHLFLGLRQRRRERYSCVTTESLLTFRSGGWIAASREAARQFRYGSRQSGGGRAPRGGRHRTLLEKVVWHRVRRRDMPCRRPLERSVLPVLRRQGSPIQGH